MIKLRINPLPSTTYHLPTTNRGFTIIELVIVITIMAILLTLGVVNLRGSQANGRDAERKTDIETIAQHLETYFTSGTDISTISSCTGGNITHDGLYTVHTFTSSGTLTCTGGNIVATVLVVAGGGGGGSSYGGGGGGGGFVTHPSLALTDSMPVVVGSGGVGASNGAGAYGTDGLNSTFGGITAIGGGGGGHTTVVGNNGGSGGGHGGAGVGVGGTALQGNSGGGTGYGYNGGPYVATPKSGGGGGAGGIGSSPDGGVGRYSSIVLASTSVGYAGGGGGWNSGTAYHGGGVYGQDGTVNTGGGGGAWDGTNIGDGASGIVVIRYATPTTSNTYPSTALTATLISMTTMLRDIDTDSLMAPGKTDPITPTQTFISATNNTQTTVGVLPQPTKDQYVYQPLHTDGSLCNDNAECSEFNLYYQTEVDNNVNMVSSINQ